MLSLRIENAYHSFQMKKSILFILSAVLMLSCGWLHAQDYGIESPITEKNIGIGIKGGINAMDMAYHIGDRSFVNHTVLYQHPEQAFHCVTGGLSVERITPLLSYGVELMVSGVDARMPKDTIRYAERDSSFFVQLRLPVRLNLKHGKKFIPYLFVAPEVSTYLYLPINDKYTINGYSVWNGVAMNWGTKNAATLHLNVIAGAGVNYKIEIGNYELLARLEAGYKMGLLNTLPNDIGMTRKMMGWEATIGLVFPLFKNPHYSWLM